MSKPPAILTSNDFHKHINRGTVIRTRILLPNGQQRNKLLIVVNLDCTLPDIYHLTCTSQTGFYKTNPFAKSYSLVIPSGTTSVFSKETVVDLSKPERFTRDDIISRYNEGRLVVLGKLPPEIMESLDRRIHSSMVIKRGIKKLIVSETDSGCDD